MIPRILTAKTGNPYQGQPSTTYVADFDSVSGSTEIFFTAAAEIYFPRASQTFVSWNVLTFFSSYHQRQHMSPAGLGNLIKPVITSVDIYVFIQKVHWNSGKI